MDGWDDSYGVDIDLAWLTFLSIKSTLSISGGMLVSALLDFD